MTSYESAYCSWFLRSNGKRILVYIGVLLTIFLLPAIISQINQEPTTSLPLSWALYTLLIINLILAIALPVLLFHFLMQKRSCDLYLPLPIKRSRFFSIQFGIGMVLMLIPHIIFYMAIAIESSSWDYLLYYIVASLGVFCMLLALFSCILFFVMKCNSLWDAVIVSIGIPLIMVMFYATMQEMLDVAVRKVITNYYGMETVSEFFPIQNASSYFSPVFACANFIEGLERSYTQYDVFYNWFHYEGVSLQVLFYWLLLAIVFFIAALQTYRKRLGEDSEQKTTSKFVYPFIIICSTMCLMFQNITDYSIFWFIVVVYFTLQFIAQRKIAIRFHMIVSLVVMALLTNITSTVIIQTKGFGRIYEITERENIVAAGLSVDFPKSESFVLTNAKYSNIKDEKIISGSSKQSTQPEVIDMIYDLEKHLVANDEVSQKENQGVRCYLEIRFRLQDGRDSNRNYMIESKEELARVKEVIQAQIDLGEIDLKPDDIASEVQ